MAGTYMLGETKVRPGSYFNIQKKGDGPASGAKNGIVGILFKSDWGPLNQAVEVSVDDGYENIFGTGGTTDAIGLAFEGGAITAICCRVGNGGTEGNVKLNTYWPEWFRRACCIQRLPAVRTGRFTEYRRRRCYQESMELLRKQTAEAPELAVNRLTIRALHQRRCNARIFYIRRTTEWIRKRM